MYQVLLSGGVLDLATGQTIKRDLSSPDWQAYREWLKAGNAPLPPDPPTPEQMAADQAAKDAETAAFIANKFESLWRAADAYTAGHISGVAIGILTIGVIQGKPKALAIADWSSAVWAIYYERKALVTAASVDDLNFGLAGSMPYSVPELQAEVFGV